MHCSACQFENRRGAKFCEQCGSKLDVLCPECGTQIPGSSKFCGECGHRLLDAIAAQKKTLHSDNRRKRVTVLFSDMSGYPALTERLDPEETRDVMNRIFNEIARVVANYEGLLEKFIGDAVMAIFGISRSHADNAVRAVRAAGEIHAAVENINTELKNAIELTLSMHSGINTGPIVTGVIDLDKGCHGVLGGTVNLASRLSSLAQPGEILVAPETHKLVAPYFNTMALREMDIKGISRPVAPYRILEESAL
jgi:class 3 adenylate cyclase